MPYVFELPTSAPGTQTAGSAISAVGSLLLSPDVRIFQGPDGGDIAFSNGAIEMSSGLESAAYLSMFGGNARDGGLPGDDPHQWWGNASERDQTRKLRSETQRVLRGVPATTGNLIRVQEAASRDVAWMAEALGGEVAAFVTMPGKNRVAIELRVSVGDARYQFVFTSEWSGGST